MRIPLEDFTEVSLVINDTKHSRKKWEPRNPVPAFFGQIRKNTGETDATTNADAAVANAAACASDADADADADISDADANITDVDIDADAHSDSNAVAYADAKYAAADDADTDTADAARLGKLEVSTKTRVECATQVRSQNKHQKNRALATSVHRQHERICSISSSKSAA